MKIETFYEDGRREIIPFSDSLLRVAFNLSEYSEEQDLWVYVLSHKGTVIYSTPVHISQ